MPCSTKSKPQAFKLGFTLSELLVSLTVLGLIAGLTVPSIITSVEKSKRQALLKEGFQIISSIVQAGYLNGDFASITSWDVVNDKGTGSIVDYFNQKLNAAYRCNTNDTTRGCGRNMNTLVIGGARNWSGTTRWNHNAVWIMPSSAMYWINNSGLNNANGVFFNIASDAYATDLYISGNNPSVIHFFCNLSDILNNAYSAYGASNVKPGTCGMMYGGLGDFPYTGLTN
jgi:prepilin-type N-terminal cleavage/methylation domain-containing protein